MPLKNTIANYTDMYKARAQTNWSQWTLLWCGKCVGHTMIGYRFHFGSVCWLFFVLFRQSGEKIVHPPAPAAAASYFFELVQNVFLF